MSISAKHSRSSKHDRQIQLKGRPLIEETKFNKADALVELVYVDICNGGARSDCMKKLTTGAYGNKPYSVRQSEFYYRAALNRLAENTDIEAENMKNILWSRYESLLETAVKKDDLYNARGILDSMARIFGIEKKMPSTAVQINAGEDKIVVNFGLENETS